MLHQPDRPSLQQRRRRLSRLFEGRALLWSGQPSPRNFPANLLPFRASSHFLYFVGSPLPNAVVVLEGGEMTLLIDEAEPEEALWHGGCPSRAELADRIGADQTRPLSDLDLFAPEAATIPVQDWATRYHQAEVLGRSLSGRDGAWRADALECCDLAQGDFQLARAIATLRLEHDAAALHQLRQAADLTVKAHLAGMASRSQAQTEAEVRGAVEAVFLAAQCSPAYASIVTTQAEVLHNPYYHHALNPGELLLVDAGAETPMGWAADVTRTWPVSGEFSASQQDLYNLVLAAHDACLAKAAPGVEFRDIHLSAALVLTEGLVDLGILKGDPEGLVARDAHGLFFPHGVGHLLGLDVHDMEDLGDLAGYASGRQRSERLGLSFLRLDRPLQPGMLVTIEPGFYQIPALLHCPEYQQQYGDCINWEVLAQFRDVRGIRIEDDVLITETGCEVLTAALPTSMAEISACCALQD
ncbi:MAG: aminopeptidase P family protein [Acaryochloridaceae cyanobacterium SU_2_1]|nr:aminopeptidase P family protein [Acaryochloridaceae cyanobacterium SU_2_1]